MKISKHRFTGIRYSGNTQVWADAGWPEVFRDMFSERQTGGSNYDGFNMLLCDGKILIAEKVQDLAWAYCRETDDLVANVRHRMLEKHWPPGHEPPKDAANLL